MTLHNGHLEMVRCMERGVTDIEAIANTVCITPGTVQVYVSQIRGAFGYSSILGSPLCGYRIGEWPGREIPRPYGKQKRRAYIPRENARGPYKRKEFDSSAGVVITEAGKALGLK